MISRLEKKQTENVAGTFPATEPVKVSKKSVTEYKLKPGEESFVLPSSTRLTDLKDLKDPAIVEELISSILIGNYYKNLKDCVKERELLGESRGPIWALEIVVPEKTFTEPQTWTIGYQLEHLIPTLKNENIFKVYLVTKPMSAIGKKALPFIPYFDGVLNPGFVSPVQAKEKRNPGTFDLSELSFLNTKNKVEVLGDELAPKSINFKTTK